MTQAEGPLNKSTILGLAAMALAVLVVANDFTALSDAHTETKMFRRVDLPAGVPGRLLLHSMPGRYEAIESVWHQVRNEAVGAIVFVFS